MCRPRLIQIVQLVRFSIIQQGRKRGILALKFLQQQLELRMGELIHAVIPSGQLIGRQRLRQHRFQRLQPRQATAVVAAQCEENFNNGIQPFGVIHNRQSARPAKKGQPA